MRPLITTGLAAAMTVATAVPGSAALRGVPEGPSVETLRHEAQATPDERRQRQAERQAAQQQRRQAAEQQRQAAQEQQGQAAQQQRQAAEQQRQAAREAQRQATQEQRQAERQAAREAERQATQEQRPAARRAAGEAERQLQPDGAQEERRQAREERRERRQEAREDLQEERRERQDERREARDERLERREAVQEDRQEFREERRETRQERVEARRERLQERRQALREDLREERREARRDRLQERREAHRERLRDWERQQVLGLRRDRRELLDYGFFDRAAPVYRGRDRVIFETGGVSLVVGAGVGRLGWGAEDVAVRELPNGWTRTVVTRPNGVRVVTLADAYGIPIRRVRVLPNGERIVLFNNLPEWWGGREQLVINVPPPQVNVSYENYVVEPSQAPDTVVYETLTAEPVAEINRSYTLNQVLLNENVRAYMPRVDLDTINFATGSAEVPDSEIETLEAIGIAIEEAVEENPQEVFLIEGHTDAVGPEMANLELSDRRAESVAEILTEYFEIPPENLVTQGFGEEYLKVPTEGPSAENRRVAVRRITPLLATSEEVAGLGEDYEDLDGPVEGR